MTVAALPERVRGESAFDRDSFSIHPNVSSDDVVSEVISIKESKGNSATFPFGVGSRGFRPHGLVDKNSPFKSGVAGQLMD